MTRTPTQTRGYAPGERQSGSFFSPDLLGERRQGRREAMMLRGQLLRLGDAAPIRCQIDNVGEGGLHVVAPVGYGFAVGQRYEVLMTDIDPALLDSGPEAAGHYATVVRTEMCVGAPDDHVGVGLRFDQPLLH